MQVMILFSNYSNENSDEMCMIVMKIMQKITTLTVDRQNKI